MTASPGIRVGQEAVERGGYQILNRDMGEAVMSIRFESLADVVDRCQTVMAHAWMVRTFVKHSDEVEDFPELMGIVRAVFDTSRALETRVGAPEAYLHMLKKKISRLRAAAAQFQIDAPEASTHTNFQQAVISMNACVDELTSLIEAGTALAE